MLRISRHPKARLNRPSEPNPLGPLQCATSLTTVRAWRTRAARVLREDVWAKGVSGTLQTMGRMLWLLARWPAHRRWCRIVGGPTTRAILDVYPRIVYIHSFAYLFAGATARQRLAMASAHYRFLNQSHDAPFFEAVMATSGLTLWRSIVDERVLSIALLGPCLVSRHHEGDLTLAFAIDGHIVSKTAFSVIGRDAVPGIDAGSRYVIYMGQVQGTAGAHDLIRDATRLLGAVAPRDLLMSALAGAAEAWGIDTLLGVPGAQLLSIEALRNSSSGFDYATFWREFGASETPEGQHVMRLPFPEKPIDAIPSRHRKRTLAKRRLKHAVKVALTEAVRSRLARPDPRP